MTTHPAQIPNALVRTCVAAALLLCGVVACGGSNAPLPDPAATHAPLARLWLPHFGAPTDPLSFTATDSVSAGGAIAHYKFDFGDGSASLDQGSPIATHAYASEGVYAVQLTVVDLDGKSATVQGQLTVRTDPPSCTQDSDCSAAQKCGQLVDCCSGDGGCTATQLVCAQGSLCFDEIGSVAP